MFDALEFIVLSQEPLRAQGGVPIEACENPYPECRNSA
jgi:hypothetical protein